MGVFATATIVEEHKVSDGDSLDSLAADAGISWQELAEYNWGTSDQQQINQCLVEVVGCTKKTQDGSSYLFTSTDDPGLVWIPKKDWKYEGLPVDDTHTFRVLADHYLVIRLVDDLEHPIPETSYTVTFEDGSTSNGNLGRAGLALIKNPSPGMFSVLYPDHDDILAKSLAGYSHDAFAKNNSSEVFALLQHPTAVIQATFSAYNAYYNDLSGNGWLADMRATVTDEEALAVAEALLAYSDIQNSRGIKIVEQSDDEP